MLMGSSPPPTQQEADEGELDFAAILKSILDVVRRRYQMMIAIAIAIFGLVIVALLLMTPRYGATAKIKIDPKNVAINGMTMEQGPSMPDQSIVDTEVGVIGSRDVLRAVVRQLHLASDPEFTPQDDKLSPSSTEFFEDTVDKVEKRLSVFREKSTYLVDVTFSSTDADKAARIANAVAENYIKATVARRAGTAEQQYSSLDKRLADLSVQAKAADAALAQYQASAGITEGGQLGTVTDQQIAPLSTQLATAQAEAASAASDLAVARSQMVRGGAAGASTVLNSPAIQSLRTNRAQVEQMLSQLNTRYGPKHPQTVQAQQQLAAIDSQIGQEAQRIIGELTARKSAAEAQAGSLRSDLSRLRGEQAGNARLAVTASSLKRDAEAKHNEYNRVADVAQQLAQGSQSSLSQAQIVEVATAPDRPSSPKKLLILGLGALLAVTLSTSTIAVQELMTAGFLTTRDLDRHTGLRFLASVPMVSKKDMDGQSPARILMTRPMSAYAETFRTLRSSLVLSGDTPAQVVAVVSTLPGEGKTNVTLSLARVMALSGDRTLVIDGDIRRAGIAGLIGKTPQQGLVEVLRDGAPLTNAVLPDEVPGLDVLTSTKASFLPDDLFGGEAMEKMLAVLRQKYDRIVIDTPPLLGVADARTIVKHVDAAVLVVKWNKTPRAAVKSALRWLQIDNAPLVGTVFTMVNPKSEALGALYYSKAYANYYQSA